MERGRLGESHGMVGMAREPKEVADDEEWRKGSPKLEEREAPVAIFYGALAYKLRDDLRRKTPRLIEPEDLYSGCSTVDLRAATMTIVAGILEQLNGCASYMGVRGCSLC